MNSPSSEPTNTNNVAKAPRSLFFTTAVLLLVALVLLVTGYSLWVAFHEPDRHETVVLGQTKLAAGAPGALRIVVRDRVSKKPLQNAAISLALADKSGNQSLIKLGAFKSDSTGSIAEAIEIPNIPPGDYQLIIDSESPLGHDHLTRSVNIHSAARILLSTDKPIYQPAQMIRLRTLVLNARTQKPFTNEPITFEIKDPKGNKVFKETRRTSSFGIASADFELATEVNLGQYQIQASSGPATAERTVEVKHYVLPKFKIQITTDSPYYLPGQTVSGTVHAAYFFGKPVAGANLKLVAKTMAVQDFTVAEISGHTDASGDSAFRFALPQHFAGLPQNGGNALLDLTAELTDTAQHAETRTLSLSIAESDLQITAIPEVGRFIPGVENIVYVTANHPDGTPARHTVTVDGKVWHSDQQGVSEVRVTPVDTNSPLTLDVADGSGRSHTLTLNSNVRQAGTILLRTDKAVYQSGETARLTLLSPANNRTVFIDVIKDEQTVLTRSLVFKDHKADYTLGIPPSLAGLLKIHAYVISETGEDFGTLRTICVNPAAGLKIAAQFSKSLYKPGDTAKLTFAVTDSTGRPTPSALGLAAVDEAVFALYENRPGLLQQFLNAESDLLRPRYQHFDSPARLFNANNQNLAKACLASLESHPNRTELQELLASGMIDQRTINHIKSMRGTPFYQKIQTQPEYIDIINLIEGELGLYTFRESTAVAKQKALEQHRKQYFDNLKKWLLILALVVLVFLPIGSLFYVLIKEGKQGLLVFIFCIFLFLIFGVLLLPNFVRARATSQSASLINSLRQLEAAQQMASLDRISSSENAPPLRIRRNFPKTLFWQPELITDDHGKATLEIPLADSITTWRLSVDAISASGRMGSADAPIAVFQDFFVDIDLPASLSLGDEVSVPITCFNYLKDPQDIRLNLSSADWFQTDSRHQTIHLAAGEIRSIRFPIKVLRAGTHRLQVSAQNGKTADAIEREIRVVPTGERIDNSANETLKERLTTTITIASNAVPESQSLQLKFYPSRFTEVVEGLDAILAEPHGCFEQTSSTTYPNVLVLEYMKRMGRVTPEIEVRARKLINAGYQRLLTFEVQGGGFEWFGHDPAHVGLTAYGLLEFTDMSRVHPVDEAMVHRTRRWLYSRQNPDGSWDLSHGLDAWSGNSPVTAYVAWALAESGDASPALDKALGLLRSNPEKLPDAYQKALAANALLARDKTDSCGLRLVDALRKAAITKGSLTHWSSSGYSMTYSHGGCMDVETTALCVMALMKAGVEPQTVKQALTWISKQKNQHGSWDSTQATILAIRALILGSGASLGQDHESTISVYLNGARMQTLKFNKANSDVMRQIDLSHSLQPGENQLELLQTPDGELSVQIAASYWIPSAPVTNRDLSSPLQIESRYDRTSFSIDDQVQCAARVSNNTITPIRMAIVDLGIPPGFDVETETFAKLQQAGQIAKFETTGNQIILYLRELSPNQPVTFTYTLRARYPLHVQAPPSSVYEYYQPQNRARQSTTQELHVR